MLVLIFAQTLSVQSKDQRPNIVLYVADDLGTIDIGPYGNKSVKTPNLDKLAKESLLFNKAFATSPTCVPARSALFTAQYPHRNGSHVNRMPVHSDVKSIVQYFNKEGYQVAIAGKLHIGPQEVFAFDYIAGSNRREPGTEGLTGMFTDLYLKPVRAWLTKRTDPRPFVLIVADHSTHTTWPLNPIYSNADIRINPFHVDTDGTRKMLTRYYTDITKMDDNVGETMDMLKANNLENNTILIFTADQGPQLPFGKWTLYDYGVQVPLLMRWPQKIKADSSTDALVSHVDIIPTLLSLVHGKIPTDIDGRSFDFILENPKKNHREIVFATHNGDKMHDQSPTRMLRTKQFKYIVNLEPDGVVSTGKKPLSGWKQKANSDTLAQSIVDRLNARPVEELYDLLNDPYELKNLASQKKYRAVLENFRNQMDVIRKDQGDIGNSWQEDLKKLPPNNKPNPLVPYIF